MDALRAVPAWAGARGFVRLAPSIFAGLGIGAGAIGLADIVGLRRILRDIVARILGLVGGDRVQLIGLLGVDRLRRALPGAAGRYGQEDHRRDKQAALHGIPHWHWLRFNARAATWGAA